MRAERLKKLVVQRPDLVGEVSGLPEGQPSAAAPAPAVVRKWDPAAWVDRAVAMSPRWLRGLAGNLLWSALHRRALAVPAGESDAAWLAGFRQAIPCGDCRKHWDAMLAATPPDWSAYFAWTVARHNEVNRRLGKPEMGLEEALQRWGGAANKAPIHRTSSGP